MNGGYGGGVEIEELTGLRGQHVFRFWNRWEKHGDFKKPRGEDRCGVDEVERNRGQASLCGSS